MKYSKLAQEQLDILATYREIDNEEMKTCDIVHLYDTKKLCARSNGDLDGFVDARFFTAWCFNLKDKTKCKYEGRDELNLFDVRVQFIRIFVDGSTLVRFMHTVKIMWGQSLYFKELTSSGSQK